MSIADLVFVDCEARGPCPTLGQLLEFGAVHTSRKTFHAILTPERWRLRQLNILTELDTQSVAIEQWDRQRVFLEFEEWIKKTVARSAWSGDRIAVMVSDNPAYDWQWINDGFHRELSRNPFGHSARRIGDFYAGLRGDFFTRSLDWKRMRKTKHDHHPVHDALGNLEAFEKMILKGRDLCQSSKS